MRLRNVCLLAMGIALSTCVNSAYAALELSFDQSNYLISPANGTVDIKVFVSQTPGGPQVGLGNELLTAGIQASFANPAGVAAVASSSDIVGGPAWDFY